MNNIGKLKQNLPRIIISVLLIILSAIFLKWQISLWNGDIGRGYNFNEWICKFFKLFGPSAYPDQRAYYYIYSTSMVLMIYYGTVSIKRVISNTTFQYIIAAFSSTLGIVVSLKATLTHENVDFWCNLCVAVYVLAIVLILTTVYIPSAIKNRKKLFNLTTIKNAAIRYALVMTVTLLDMLMTTTILGIFNYYNPVAVRRVMDSFSRVTVTSLIGLCVLDQLFEETAFRGLIFGHLEKYITTWPAIIISSVFFGLWHRNIGQFVYTLPAGIIFCLILKKTGRLRYSIFSHSFYSILGEFALGTKSTVIPKNFLQDLTNFLINLPLPAAIVLFVAAMAGMALIFIKAFPKEELELK